MPFRENSVGEAIGARRVSPQFDDHIDRFGRRQIIGTINRDVVRITIGVRSADDNRNDLARHAGHEHEHEFDVLVVTEESLIVDVVKIVLDRNPVGGDQAFVRIIEGAVGGTAQLRVAVQDTPELLAVVRTERPDAVDYRPLWRSSRDLVSVVVHEVGPFEVA